MWIKYGKIYGELGSKWAELMRELKIDMSYDVYGTSNPKGETVFLELCRKYSESHRYYHNPKHLLECLREFNEARGLAEFPLSVSSALWFHDVVYDTKAEDNEEKSEQYARKKLQALKLPDSFIQRVGNLVLITKHSDKPKNTDEKLVLDIDLSILGKSEEVFNEYEKNIRQEYSWVDEEEFRKARSRILESFLSRDSIYQTDFFRDKYEVQARKNLERSINILTNPVP
ncbi:MAG: N-methyl-D-aspartate receptor NMDAR2C subunit [Candidatus Nanoarchaeia archaeon]|nr:N-methyl-D-aspartate receptor NMDAR2C subunit [Candidatus Nanoarchaeia archaeon]